MKTTTWKHYGRHDPYYGVLSSEQYRTAHMDDAARERFFASGVEAVDEFIGVASRAFGSIHKGTAIDFGCGVGRLTRVLAERFQHVVGIDLSIEMLDEAQHNLVEHSNVQLQRSDEPFPPADFVLSKIVFQHIPPAEGLRVLGNLAGTLSPGGIGVIDFPIRYTGSRARDLLRQFKTVFARNVIPMYVYELADIEHALRGMEVHVDRAVAPRFEKAIVAFRRASGSHLAAGTR